MPGVIQREGKQTPALCGGQGKGPIALLNLPQSGQPCQAFCSSLGPWYGLSLPPEFHDT